MIVVRMLAFLAIARWCLWPMSRLARPDVTTPAGRR